MLSILVIFDKITSHVDVDSLQEAALVFSGICSFSGGNGGSFYQDRRSLSLTRPAGRYADGVSLRADMLYRRAITCSLISLEKQFAICHHQPTTLDAKLLGEV